jgi:hypothetical protein
MGFEFGSVAHLDTQITLISFIAVILFVNLFDMITGIMEYFLEDSKLYNRMIQVIYKELMLMGLVSFIVVLTEAAQTTQFTLSHKGEEWFKAVDFAHILLFFVTFFFVCHALYLMNKSISSSHKYKYMFGESYHDLIEELNKFTGKARNNSFSFSSFLSSFIFNCSSFLSFSSSSLRDRVEFKLVTVLFRDAYNLPEDFSFAYYLSGFCFSSVASLSL